MELEKIKAIIAEVLNIDADSITEDTTFVDLSLIHISEPTRPY